MNLESFSTPEEPQHIEALFEAELQEAEKATTPRKGRLALALALVSTLAAAVSSSEAEAQTVDIKPPVTVHMKDPSTPEVGFNLKSQNQGFTLKSGGVQLNEHVSTSTEMGAELPEPEALDFGNPQIQRQLKILQERVVKFNLK